MVKKDSTIRDRLTRVTKSAKAAAPPWGLILVGAFLIAMAVSCFVQAFN